ncbi:MAG: hypothetical protein KIS86_07940 [Devosia sp.]|nr:hypothetical protein [Devosia sp.]
MKKIIAAVLATVLVTGAVAPAFAESYLQNCVFKDKSLCVVEALGSSSAEN